MPYPDSPTSQMVTGDSDKGEKISANKQGGGDVEHPRFKQPSAEEVL